MTNLNKVVTKGVTTTAPYSEYIGNSGEVTINAPAAQMSIHDGITPGGLPVGTYGFAGPFTAGSGQNPNGPVLTANAYNVVASVQNNFDSVSLPPALAGTIVFVMVPASQGTTLSIWGNGSDTINGVLNDPIDYGSLPQNSFGAAALATFICLTDGAWYANGSLD